jgi:probable F420-dependent oxidoreductase
MTKFGVSMFPTDYAIQPIPLAKAVEASGLESLFFPEHTHIPTSRRSPWPGGGDLPREYWHTHDPFVALTAAAAATENLTVGTGILLVPERDPIVTSKQIASLDMISGGRVIIGIGAGWNAEELESHGVAFKDRWKVTRESVLAWRELWTKEAAEYHGEFIQFEKSWAYPKPATPGGPPVLLGAQSQWAFDRVADYCDGWMPIDGRGDLAGGMEELKAACDRADRDFSEIDLVVFGLGADEARATELMGIGFQHLLFRLPSGTEDEVLPIIEGYAKLADGLS